MIVCSDMTLLRRFYGSENGLNLSSERASVLEHIAQGAKRIDAREAVFYLSAYYQKSVRYYVVCTDPLLMSHLSLWLNSALGTARNYVVRTQTQSELNYEQVLYERYPHGVLCIEQLPASCIQYRAQFAPDPDEPFAELKNDKAFIEARIEQTLWRWKQRPLINQTAKRPLGRLLRDLLLACEERQLQLAQNTYWEICERQLLEQRNLIAVELQVHAAGEQWSRIVAHSELGWLLQGVVSKRVNEMVLEAFARHLHLNVENLSALNWVALAERVVDQQGFFLRCPNLANVASNQRYWQFWAVFATALGYDVEPYLPQWMDCAWVEQLRQCRAQLFAANATSLAVVESSPLNNLLAQAKTLENAMQVVEYALRCYEHELPSLLSWLFDLSAEQQHTLSQLPLLAARWAQWQVTHATTADNTVNAQTFWCEWFSSRNAQFWINEDLAREQEAEDVDFDKITIAVRDAGQVKKITDRFPIFIGWMEEQGAVGSADLWLELAKLVVREDDKSWSSCKLLESIVRKFCHSFPKEHDYVILLETLSRMLDRGDVNKSSINILNTISESAPLNVRQLVNSFCCS